MILSLFIVLVVIGLVLIVLGLVKPNESAQALIGFVLLFLLSIIILQGNLEYESGSQINTTYVYDDAGDVINSSQYIAYNYNDFNDTTSHRIGYYLAIGSVVGFIGVLWSLNRGRNQDD